MATRAAVARERQERERAKQREREREREEYVDITKGIWYNLSQVKEVLGVGRSQVSTMIENDVLHPKRTRVNRKIKVVAGEEVEEARRQLEAIRRLREHMAPTREPQARLLQPALG